MYINGEGVVKDYEEAARWYRLSAEQGFPTSNLQQTGPKRLTSINAREDSIHKIGFDQSDWVEKGYGKKRGIPGSKEAC